MIVVLNRDGGGKTAAVLILAESARRRGKDAVALKPFASRPDDPAPLTIMAWDDYESLIETLEILGDPEAMDALSRAESQIAAGKGRPFEDVAAELGL